jgi:hypothetical protein
VSLHDVIYVINLVRLALCSVGENNRNSIVVVMGHAVAYTLCYKPEGRGFESR